MSTVGIHLGDVVNFPSRSNGASLRLAAVSLVTASALIIANASGVFAALTATTSSGAGQSIGTGTLKLTLSSAAPSGGVTAVISNLAPGDSEIRYIDLANDGTLDAQLLSVAVAATGDAALITDGVTSKALTIAISSCAVAWVSGACASPTVELAATALSALSTAQTLTSSSPTAGTTLHLQITTSLPEQDETTVDGVLPAGSVQGKSATLVYTFSEAQRAAQTLSN
jgi:hypothetical protein